MTTEAPRYDPYESSAANDLYNLLFCDELSVYLARHGQEPVDWQRTLAADYARPGVQSALETLANDESADGRVRYLAFRRLRETGASVSPKILLGTIIEVPLPDGLDTLAAYSEGGVRYINHTGKLVVVEAMQAVTAQVHAVLAASQKVVDAIGPSAEPRRPPPAEGNVRLTFLASGGLHFGEGPFTAMQKDSLGAAMIQAATQLLQTVTKLGARGARTQLLQTFDAT